MTFTLHPPLHLNYQALVFPSLQLFHLLHSFTSSEANGKTSAGCLSLAHFKAFKILN